YVTVSVAAGDVIVGNQFFGDTGVASLLLIGDGVSNLTIRANTFRDPDNSQNAIDISSSVLNIVIQDNTINLTGASNTSGIAVQGGGAATTTSVSILANRIDTAGNGNGIRFGPGSGGIFNAK